MFKAILSAILSIFITSAPNPAPPVSSDIQLPETLFEAPIKIDVPIKEEVMAPVACSCVRTAIANGLKIPLIDAKDLKPNGEPIIGGGILFYYPKKDIYHVAVIKEFKDLGFLVIEGNFKECEISERIVNYNDTFIIGFIK